MRTELRRATNQAPPLTGHDVITTDVALSEAVRRQAGDEVLGSLADLGRLAGG
jgi:putative acyl-CoA dehydrogenase